MADNFVTETVSTADISFASDDIAGVHYPLTKLTFGALDSQTIASSGTGVDDAGTQRVTLATDISVPIGDGTDIVDVFGSSASDGEATSANPLNTASFSYGFNGTTWDRLRSDITNGLDVDVTRVSGTVTVGGVAAENAVASGNPVLTAGRFDSSARTLGNGDVGALALNASGHLIADVSATTGGTHTDDAAFTAGTDDGVPVFGFFNDSTPDSVDEGDAGALRMSANRNLYSTIRDAAGNERGANVSAENALRVDFPDAVEDSNNSTTTPINANIDFTSPGTDVTAYAGITVSIFADQDSDANGMRFEFSSDGTNWDIPINGGFDYLASSGRTFQFDVLASFFRVVFQNGGTNQGAFRLQTLLHHHPVTLTTIHRLDADLAPDRSATVNKSVIMGQTGGTGDLSNVQLTNGQNLKISVQEISDGLDIGAGNAGSETQRVSISTDDVNLAAINAGQLADGHNVTAIAAATGGMSYDQLALAAEDNDKIIKGSAGTLYFVSIQSIDATPVYLKLFDAASITPGTTSADFQFMCPANTTAANGAGLVLNFSPGIEMGTGIVALVATGVALDDNTAVSANEVVVTLGFE